MKAAHNVNSFDAVASRADGEDKSSRGNAAAHVERELRRRAAQRTRVDSYCRGPQHNCLTRSAKDALPQHARVRLEVGCGDRQHGAAHASTAEGRELEQSDALDKRDGSTRDRATKPVVGEANLRLAGARRRGDARRNARVHNRRNDGGGTKVARRRRSAQREV